MAILLSDFLSGVLVGFVIGVFAAFRPCLSEAWPVGMSEDDGFAHFERKARKAYAVMYIQLALITLSLGLVFVWIGARF